MNVLLAGVLLRVGLQVAVEHRLGGEGLLADGAGVGFVASVSAEVDHESSALGESLLAVGALVRSLPGVGSSVDTQVVLGDEALPAVVTNVRLLSSVLPHVDRQVGLAGDGLATNGADVVALLAAVAVGPHVDHQDLLPGEPLVAELAQVLLLGRNVVRLVELGVQSEALLVPECRVAGVALEGHLLDLLLLVFLLVLLLMFLEAVQRVEPLEANFAVEFVLLLVVMSLMADQVLLVRRHVITLTAGVILRLGNSVHLLLVFVESRSGHKTAPAVIADVDDLGVIDLRGLYHLFCSVLFYLHDLVLLLRP